MAQTAITKGASVLIMDPLDSGTGAQIEKYAAAHGAQVVDYDRLVLGGSRKYYVSFDNVRVGTLLGQGMAACVTAWHVAKPNVLVMYGDPTDNNATLFGQGYNAVMNPFFSSGKWAKVGKAFPVTGQDATLIGLQNIIAGYQCGTVYKPIYLEAQAAAALAMYMRAGKTPPAALVNGSVMDTTAKVSVPSVLLTPVWVTPTNMNSTVIADKFVPASQLCAGKFASDCTAAGISG